MTSAIGPVPSVRETTTRARTLSKSDFKLARTCDAKLYFRENGYRDRREFDPYLAFLAEAGYMAEALAKAKYGDAIQLAYGGNFAEDFARTLEQLQKPNVTLFEATLLAGRRLARADVLEKRGNVIRLIEVKAKSIDGDEHREILSDGGKGVFWTRRKKPEIAAGWREKLEDITFQVLMLEEILPGVRVRPFLSLIDKSKRAAIDGIPSLFALDFEDRPDGTRRLMTGRYVGDPTLVENLDLITEFDVSEEVNALRDEVRTEAARFESMLDASLGEYMNGLQRSSKCAGCEFRGAFEKPDGFADCWGTLAAAEPHFLELFSVGRARGPGDVPLVEWMWNARKSALIDVPVDTLVNKDGTVGAQAERQRRQVEYTRLGQVFVGPSLRQKIETIQWPAHFIDFETSRLALPSHAKMRPYGVVTFQWSCHTVSAPGVVPVHSEWLNTEDLWPNQRFAESLRGAIGDFGSVITWSPFENSTLKQIIADLAEFGHDVPELVEWLKSVEARIVDLHDWAKEDYFHPGMGGRTSIKVVMDALWNSDRRMRDQFQELTGIAPNDAKDPYYALATVAIDGAERSVRDGTGAMRAYDAMMYGPGRDDAATKERWAQLLKQYCHLDTLSMVLILEHWRRAVGLA
jgi:hypothetical protein